MSARASLWGELYYIELREGSKIPARAWGGFDQDLDAAEAVLEPSGLEPGRRYGYIAHSGDRRLGVLDLDLYKDAAPSMGDVSTGRELLLVESPSGGVHVPFTMPADAPDLEVADGFGDWVDLKGELGGGHCVLPFGSEYEVTAGSADEAPHVPDVDGLGALLNVDGDALAVERDDGGVGLPSVGPPGELSAVLGDEYSECERHEHPFHGSSSGSNFYVFEGGEFWHCYRHDVGGTLLHLLGMEWGLYGCGDWARMDADERREVHRRVRRRAEEEGVDLAPNGSRWSADGPTVEAIRGYVT